MGKDKHIQLLNGKSGSSFLLPDEKASAIIDRALFLLEQEIKNSISVAKPLRAGWPKAKDNLSAKEWRFSLHYFARPIQYNRDRP